MGWNTRGDEVGGDVGGNTKQTDQTVGVESRTGEEASMVGRPHAPFRRDADGAADFPRNSKPATRPRRRLVD